MPRNQSSEVFKILSGTPPSPYSPTRKPSQLDVQLDHVKGQRGSPAAAGIPAVYDGTVHQVDSPGGSPYGGVQGGKWVGASQRLPPLLDEARMLAGQPPSPAGMLHYEAAHPARMQLEPINIALAGAAGRTAVVEDRLLHLEQRLMSAERSAAEVSRAYELQSQRMVSMSNDLARTTSELSDLRMRYDTAASAGSTAQHATQSLAQQIMTLSTEVRAQEARVASTSSQLSDALRANAELRSHVAMLSDEIARAAADRAAATANNERMARTLAQGTAGVAEEARRAIEMSDTAAREEARRRQATHLNELAALQREVEAYRAEAANAGSALRGAVERVTARLQSEELQLDRVRADSAQQAQAEAVIIGGLRNQVSELQAALAGLGQQVASEQAVRRNEMQALDFSIRSAESQLAAAQDSMLKRTVAMMDGKAAQFMKAMQDLDATSVERDEQLKAQGEQQLSAFVQTATRKEKLGVERMMMIEGAVRDVATASATALTDLQGKIDRGVSDVAFMVESAKRATEDREAALREQINSALQRIRAYARDMEESLEQERLKLEEVVKMEIRARMGAVDSLKETLQNSVTGLKTDHGGLQKSLAALQGQQQDLQAAHEALQKETGAGLSNLRSEVASTRTQVVQDMKNAMEGLAERLGNSISGLTVRVAEEESARKLGIDGLQKWFDQNQVDQKLSEELLRAEVAALSDTVAHNKYAADQQLAQQVALLKTETARQQAEIMEEKTARQALSDVCDQQAKCLGDTQRKLDAVTVRTRAIEVDLSGHIEATTERLNQLDAGVSAVAKGARKELAAVKAELTVSIATAGEQAATALAAACQRIQDNISTDMGALATRTEQKLIDFDKKMDANQSAVEAVIAETAEEATQAIAKLAVRVDETQAMLDDEVHQLEDLIDTKLTQAAADSDARFKAMQEKAAADSAAAAAELEAAVATVTDQLAEAEEKLDQCLATTDDRLTSTLAEFKQDVDSQLAGIGAQIDATELKLSDSITNMKSDMDARSGNVDQQIAALHQNLDATSDNLQAQLATTQQEQAAALAAAVATVEQQLNVAVTQLQAQAAEADTRIADALSNADKRLVESVAELSARQDEQEANSRAQVVQISESLTASQAQTATLLAGLEQQLADTKQQVDANVTAMLSSQEANQSAVEARLTQSITDLTTQLQVQLQEANNQAQLALDNMGTRVDQATADTQAAMSALQVSTTEQLQALRTELQANSEDQLAECVASIDAKISKVQDDVAAVETNLKGEVAAAVEGMDAKLVTQGEMLQGQMAQTQQALQAVVAEAQSDIGNQLNDVRSKLESDMTMAAAAAASALAVAVAEQSATTDAVKTQIREQFETSQSALASLQSQLETLISNAQTQQAAQQADLQQQLESNMSSLLNTVNEQIATVQATLNQAQAGLQESAGLLQSDLQASLNNLRTEISEQQAKAQTYVEGCIRQLQDDSLSKQTSMQAEAAARFEELERRLIEIQASLRAALQSISEINSKADTAEQHTNEAISWLQANDQNLINQLQGQATATEQLAAELQQWKSDLADSMHLDNASMAEQLQSIRAQLDAACVGLEQGCDDKLATVTAKLQADLISAIGDLQGELSALQSQHTSSLEAINQQQAQQMQESSAGLTAALQQVKEELEAAVANNHAALDGKLAEGVMKAATELQVAREELQNALTAVQQQLEERVSESNADVVAQLQGVQAELTHALEACDARLHERLSLNAATAAGDVQQTKAELSQALAAADQQLRQELANAMAATAEDLQKTRDQLSNNLAIGNAGVETQVLALQSELAGLVQAYNLTQTQAQQTIDALHATQQQVLGLQESQALMAAGQHEMDLVIQATKQALLNKIQESQESFNTNMVANNTQLQQEQQQLAAGMQAAQASLTAANQALKEDLLRRQTESQDALAATLRSDISTSVAACNQQLRDSLAQSEQHTNQILKALVTDVEADIKSIKSECTTAIDSRSQQLSDKLAADVLASQQGIQAKYDTALVELEAVVQKAATDGREARASMTSEIDTRLNQQAQEVAALSSRLDATVAELDARQKEALTAATNNINDRAADLKRGLEQATMMQAQELEALKQEVQAKLQHSNEAAQQNQDQVMQSQASTLQGIQERLNVVEADTKVQGEQWNNRLAQSENNLTGLVNLTKEELQLAISEMGSGLHQMNMHMNAAGTASMDQFAALENAIRKQGDEWNDRFAQSETNMTAVIDLAREHLQAKIAELQSEVGQSRKTIADVNASNEARALQTGGAFEQQLQALSNDLAELKNSSATSESSLTAVIDMAREDLQSKIDNLQAELDKVQAQMAAAEGANIVNASDINASFEQRLQSLNADLSVLREGLGTQTSDMASVIDQLTLAQTSLEAHDTRMQAAEEKLETLSSRIDETDTQAAGMQQTVDALGTSVEAVEKRLDVSDKAIAAAEQRLAAADVALAAIQQQVLAAETGHVATAVIQQQLASSLAEAEQKLQLVTDNLAARLEQSVAELEGSFAESAAQSQQQCDALAANLQQLKQEQDVQLLAVGDQLKQQSAQLAALQEEQQALMHKGDAAQTPAHAEQSAAQQQMIEGIQQQANALHQDINQKHADLEASIALNNLQLQGLTARVDECDARLKDASASSQKSTESGLTLEQLQDKLQQERAETSSQLDSLRLQVKDEAKEMVAQDMIEYKAEQDKKLEVELDDRQKKNWGSLERALHRALDESWDNMKVMLQTDIQNSTKQMGDDVKELKNRQDYLQHRLDEIEPKK